MTEYLTEQEQIELLKNWVKQYSLVILAGIMIAVVSMSGWRYWQQRQINILTHASSVYDEMLTARAQNDTAATSVQAKKLFQHYSQTAYGQMAALMLARDAMLKKDYAGATDQLNWVLNHSKITAIKQIARLRLARIALAQQKPQDAINYLEATDDTAFNGLIDEIKGDAYLQMNDRARARQAYQQSLTELPNAEAIRPLLQMKYDNLAT